MQTDSAKFVRLIPRNRNCFNIGYMQTDSAKFVRLIPRNRNTNICVHNMLNCSLFTIK